MLKLITAILVLGSTLSAFAAEKAPKGTPKTFAIPKYGQLTFVLPENWEATLEVPADGSPIRINMGNHAHPAFSMVVTHMNPPVDKEPVTPERMLKLIKEAMVGIKGEAKESSIAIDDLKGKQAYGHWFAFTRTAKGAANLPHATHFRIAVGDLILGGVMVQRYKSGDIQRQGLSILKSATLKPVEDTSK